MSVLDVAEKDAEIARLKADFQKAKEWNQLSELQITNLQNIIEAQAAEISRLKAILWRAANALDNGQLRILEEMREAAQDARR